MAKDHVERLEQARKTLVDRRRALARSLANSKEQIESEADRLMKIQGAIEAIDRALEDERQQLIQKPDLNVQVEEREQGH